MNNYSDKKHYRGSGDYNNITYGFCPMCNYNLPCDASYCACGWVVNKKAIMKYKIPTKYWVKIKPFVDEYKILKDNGRINSGYEYFKYKCSNLELGKIVINKIKINPSYEDDKKFDDIDRLNNQAESTFPSEW